MASHTQILVNQRPAGAVTQALSRATPANALRIAGIALGLVHVLMLIVGLTDELLLACTTTSAVTFALIWYALSQKLAFELSFVIVFAIGNVMSWGYFNFAYVRFTNFTVGYNHELSAWMASLLIGGAGVGAAVGQRMLGRETLSRERFQRFVRRWETLVVIAVVFGLVTIGYLLTGWLDSRWVGNEEGFGLAYVVRGIGFIGYTLFVVMGARLRPPLSSPSSLISLSTATLLALAQGLSGGRTGAVFIFVLLLVGALVSELGFRRWLALALGIGVTGMLFMSVVGDARSREGFAYGSVSDRMYAISTAARDSSEEEDDGEGPTARLVSRFFQTPGQVVIDGTVWTQRYAGFENFERLLTVMLPKAVVPDKLPVSDSNDVLIRDYGYQLNEFYSVPIMLLADAYRRGGVLWVGLLGLCAGVWMRFLLRWTMSLLGADLGVMCCCSLIIQFLNAHWESVLGFINLMTYVWLKQVVLFAILGGIMRLLGLLTAPAQAVNRSGFT